MYIQNNCQDALQETARRIEYFATRENRHDPLQFLSENRNDITTQLQQEVIIMSVCVHRHIVFVHILYLLLLLLLLFLYFFPLHFTPP